MTDLSEKTLEEEIIASRLTQPGSANRRAYVGPPNQYDFMGATQFRLLTGLGLREENRLVDIGCGSLRAGRYLIPYLMPDRYIGIEPNAWLWREALDREIGADIARIKRPRFLAEADFSLGGIPDDSVDAIVAQSIYSHTGADLMRQSLEAVARCLTPFGQCLFTVVLPEAAHAARKPSGMEREGWIYPQCVTYAENLVLDTCLAEGLFAQRLKWFHPRQTWFRATRDPDLQLTPRMEAELGSGRPQFDTRFCPSH